MYSTFDIWNATVYDTNGNKLSNGVRFLDVGFPATSDTFQLPYLLPNASENQSQQEALISGQFTFFIVSPRFFD